MVTATWVPPMLFAGTAPRGATVLIDATPDDGGSGRGPTPMENLLLSLAACTGMDVVSLLRKKRITLEDLRIDVTGERAATHPRIFTKHPRALHNAGYRSQHRVGTKGRGIVSR
jgi:putative redox protein